MTIEHAELAQRVAAQRDQAAFCLLFEHFAPRLKSYLLGMHVHEDLAEDIVQETMSQLWHKAHMFDPAKAALSTWLFRIAHNRLIDHWRLESRNRSSSSTGTQFASGRQLGNGIQWLSVKDCKIF